MNPRRDGIEARARVDSDAVPGPVVIGRVWRDGLKLGAACGVVFAWLWLGGAVLLLEPSVGLLLVVLLFAPVVGAPAGLAVAAVVAPVAALVLLGCRRLTDHAPTVATIVTVAGLGLVSAELFGGSPDETTAFAGLQCLVAAWPMHRALRLALRQTATGGTSGRRHGVWVSARIHADVATLWDLTQDTRRHERWDVRFGRIRPTGDGAFTYRRFGVAGTGTHRGDRDLPDGGATSALSFACANPLSPIESGAGFWRYRPDGDGTRFETGYDYVPRYGAVDRAFRPLMAWGTAWSFDRLRLWAERGVAPEVATAVALLDVSARCVLALATVLLLATSWAAAAAGLAGGVVAVALLLVMPPSPWTPAARRTAWSWQPHPSTSRPHHERTAR